MRRLALAGALALAACGADDSTPASATSPTASTLPSASISVAIEAKSVTPTGDPGTPMLARWTIVIRETGGVAGRLRLVNSTLRDASSGARAWPKGTASLVTGALVELLGSDRLPAGGSVSIPFSLQYAFVSGGKVGILTVAVQVVDDNDHVLSAMAESEIR